MQPLPGYGVAHLDVFCRRRPRVKLGIFFNVQPHSLNSRNPPPTRPKSRHSGVTSSARLHPTKQALQMLYCAQMGWPGPSTSLPEDFDTWLVVLVVLSS